jgi:hypothetical protein
MNRTRSSVVERRLFNPRVVWAIIHCLRRGIWTEPSSSIRQDSMAGFAEMETPPIRLTKYYGSFET